MIIKTAKKERTYKRHQRLRKRIIGTKEKPRLSIYTSNKHIYAQLIDDTVAHTLVSCSTIQQDVKKGIKTTWTKESAKHLGEMVAKMALQKGIKTVVFDRGGNKYHGKIKAFADAARSANLTF